MNFSNIKSFFSFFIISLLFSTIHLVAQTNLCSTAIPINCTQSIQGTNVGANDTPIPDCFSPGNNALRQTVWFLVTGDGSDMTASTCGGFTDFDTQISIYDYPCAGGIATNLTCITQDDDGCGASGGGSVASWTTTSGTNYLIAVFGFSNTTGNFQLDLTCSNTPCPNSVSVSSNGPICVGEDAEYLIAPSSGSNPTPGGLVYYTLDGVNGFTYLDVNGEGLIVQPNPPVGVPGSQIQLTEIRNQNNLCPLSLGNGATVLVNDLPGSVSVTSNGPICAGELGQYFFEPSPNADPVPNGIVDFTLDGINYAIALNGNGLGVIDLNGFSDGFPIAQEPLSTIVLNSVTDPITGCISPLSNGASIAVNEIPEITSVTSVSPVCVGENKQWDIIGTPNATFDISISNVGNYSVAFDNSGNYQFSNLANAANAMNSPLVLTVSNLQLNGCSGDVSNIAPVELIVNPLPELISYDFLQNPNCEGTPNNFEITGTPDATVVFNIDGAVNTVVLNSSGIGGVNVNAFTPGASNWVMETISLNGCITDLSNEPTIVYTVNENPEITSYSVTTPSCGTEGELSVNFTGTPNASFNIEMPGIGSYNPTLDSNGNHTFGFVGDIAPGNYSLSVLDVSLNGCIVDLSGEPPFNFVVNPPPANDACIDALPIYCTETVTGTNDCAETVTIDDCINGGTRDYKAVWYSFIGDGSIINATTCSPNTDYDALVQIYEGTCGNLICVSGDNDGCGTTGGPAVAVATTVPGTLYYIMVAGNTLGDIGNYNLSIGCANTPCPNSVSVVSNGPICEGEDGVYTIAPSPNANPTPAGIVSYTLDGNADFLYLDQNGEATIIVPSPPNGVPGSIISLNTITNQNNTCPTSLSNGASITVEGLPSASVSSVNSTICVEDDAVFIITGTPNATVSYDDTDSFSATNTITLDGNGIATITVVNSDIGYTYLDIFEVVSNGALCSVSYSLGDNFAEVLEEYCNTCPTNLMLANDPELAGIYEAEIFIESVSKITDPNSDVLYSAGDYIDLNAGFEVGVNADFEAIILGCVPVTLTDNEPDNEKMSIEKRRKMK